ncbi:MAG: DUF3379 domain-containing protein [Gammaproteobacteria bacterium]|nr:DUF3379 domain-containing protein [Gammaproteobacteria bacterium]MDH3766937.1 DUF3379 domain-containing protein [Gammaproteobacteria bacterium]
MNCIDYRRLITSDPSHVGAEGLRHRLACSSCASFAVEMQQFDTKLRQAMMIEPPRDLESRVMLAASGRSTTRRRWLAVAATLVLAVGGVVTVLNSYSLEQLPDHVIKHLYHEANLLVPVSTELVPAPRLRQVLKRTGVELSEDVDEVIHAGVCYFRGHLVPHLVVLSADGPVTVMLLPDEKVDETMPIDEDGFHGVIVPVKGGSIAIIGSGNYPEQIERQFVQAVEWQT